MAFVMQKTSIDYHTQQFSYHLLLASPFNIQPFHPLLPKEVKGRTVEMADNPIHFGIIGSTNMANKMSRAINLAPNSILYAIGGLLIEEDKKFAMENGLSESVKIYGRYDEVLDDPSVDAVYIALPLSLHVRWAVAAAQKKKHLLLEKPTALKVSELDEILKACESNGVQFMDCTVWMHHPRTAKMEELLSDGHHFGELKLINSISTFPGTPELSADDTLGVLGDMGWHCIRAILWAAKFQLPSTVTALPAIIRNEAGVILACGGSFHWERDGDEKVAAFYSSFLSQSSMDLTVCGSRGSLHLQDLIIPYQENSASFEFTSGANFVELHIGWNVKPEKVQVSTEIPQEVLMVQEFARLVKSIRNSGGRPDIKWPEISRRTQLVLDAVNKSIEIGFKPVKP